MYATQDCYNFMLFLFLLFRSNVNKVEEPASKMSKPNRDGEVSSSSSSTAVHPSSHSPLKLKSAGDASSSHVPSSQPPQLSQQILEEFNSADKAASSHQSSQPSSHALQDQITSGTFEGLSKEVLESLINDIQIPREDFNFDVSIGTEENAQATHKEGVQQCEENALDDDIDALVSDMDKEESLARSLNQLQENVDNAQSSTEHNQLQHKKIQILTDWVLSSFNQHDQLLFNDAMCLFNETPRYNDSCIIKNFELCDGSYKLQEAWERLVEATRTNAVSPFIVSDSSKNSQNADLATSSNSSIIEPSSVEIKKTCLNLLKLKLDTLMTPNRDPFDYDFRRLLETKIDCLKEWVQQTQKKSVNNRFNWALHNFNSSDKKTSSTHYILQPEESMLKAMWELMTTEIETIASCPFVIEDFRSSNDDDDDEKNM